MRLTTFVLILLPLASCTKDNSGETGLCSLDMDGDGVISDRCGGPDCNDSDATVLPGGVEQCDTLDNDCDGVVDEDFDGDGDGYLGTACSGVLATDCDDTDAGVNPGAPEVCSDTVDNNCDGLLPSCVQEYTLVSLPGTSGTSGYSSVVLDSVNPTDDLFLVSSPEEGIAGEVYAFSAISGTVTARTDDEFIIEAETDPDAGLMGLELFNFEIGGNEYVCADDEYFDSSKGRVYCMEANLLDAGPATGPIENFIGSGFVISGTTPFGYLGTTKLDAQDVNGDGFKDIIAGTGQNIVYVWYGDGGTDGCASASNFNGCNLSASTADISMPVFASQTSTGYNMVDLCSNGNGIMVMDHTLAAGDSRVETYSFPLTLSSTPSGSWGTATSTTAGTYGDTCDTLADGTFVVSNFDASYSMGEIVFIDGTGTELRKIKGVTGLNTQYMGAHPVVFEDYAGDSILCTGDYQAENENTSGVSTGVVSCRKCNDYASCSEYEDARLLISDATQDVCGWSMSASVIEQGGTDYNALVSTCKKSSNIGSTAGAGIFLWRW